QAEMPEPVGPPTPEPLWPSAKAGSVALWGMVALPLLEPALSGMGVLPLLEPALSGMGVLPLLEPALLAPPSAVGTGAARSMRTARVWAASWMPATSVLW